MSFVGLFSRSARTESRALQARGYLESSSSPKIEMASRIKSGRFQGTKWFKSEIRDVFKTSFTPRSEFRSALASAKSKNLILFSFALLSAARRHTCARVFSHPYLSGGVTTRRASRLGLASADFRRTNPFVDGRSDVSVS